MRLKYILGTTRLYFELRHAEVSVTKDLDDNTLFDPDEDGNTCTITAKHAKDRADIARFSFEHVAARQPSQVAGSYLAAAHRGATGDPTCSLE